MKKLLLLLLVVGMVFVFGLTAYAENVVRPAYMGVYATALSECRVDSKPIEFGVLGPGQNLGQGTIKVCCTDNVGGFTMSIGPGNHYESDIASRQLYGEGGDLNPYQIWTEGIDTALWGDGVTNGLGVPYDGGAGPDGTGSWNGCEWDLYDVFGSITDPSTGNLFYQDHVLVTLIFD